MRLLNQPYSLELFSPASAMALPLVSSLNSQRVIVRYFWSFSLLGCSQILRRVPLLFHAKCPQFRPYCPFAKNPSPLSFFASLLFSLPPVWKRNPALFWGEFDLFRACSLVSRGNQGHQTTFYFAPLCKLHADFLIFFFFLSSSSAW